MLKETLKIRINEKINIIKQMGKEIPESLQKFLDEVDKQSLYSLINILCCLYHLQGFYEGVKK